MPSIPRLSREMIVTEKIDGTNASIYIPEIGGPILAGSRTRWITPESDNFGFARWVRDNEDVLRALGPGHHYGEWWGSGVQRGYGLLKGEKRFSLFNVSRWGRPGIALPEIVNIVPLLYTGPFDTAIVDTLLAELRDNGSHAAPGFMQPEGVVVYHTKGNYLFKKTIEKDEGKGA